MRRAKVLTIGAFARASHLSPKALRLYDELGLLRPAAVDPVSGYRYYEAEQLERARLVAWLRRIGMPLARIKVVCELGGVAAAREVDAYWRRIEAETEVRGKLAAFLIDHLSRKEVDMSTLARRYAVRSDRGLVRESNQDIAYADARLLTVADGFGAAANTRPASAAAIDALKAVDTAVPVGDLLNVLDGAVHRASTAVGELAEEGIGTTFDRHAVVGFATRARAHR